MKSMSTPDSFANLRDILAAPGAMSMAVTFHFPLASAIACMPGPEPRSNANPGLGAYSSRAVTRSGSGVGENHGKSSGAAPSYVSSQLKYAICRCLSLLLTECGLELRKPRKPVRGCYICLAGIRSHIQLGENRENAKIQHHGCSILSKIQRIDLHIGVNRITRLGASVHIQASPSPWREHLRYMEDSHTDLAPLMPSRSLQTI